MQVIISTHVAKLHAAATCTYVGSRSKHIYITSTFLLIMMLLLSRVHNVEEKCLTPVWSVKNECVK